MMPSVLRVSGPDIERDGAMLTPRALVSICEVQPCDLPAVFGERTKEGFKTWCRDHIPDAGKMLGQHPPPSPKEL